MDNTAPVVVNGPRDALALVHPIIAKYVENIQPYVATPQSQESRNAALAAAQAKRDRRAALRHR